MCTNAQSMAANGSQVEEYQSFVRGHHVYFTIWTPVVGEELVLRRQPDNEHDPYAVAVKDEEVAGHVPRNISQVVSFFLSHSGNVGFCNITGPRVNRGVGLGLEVPCVYKFYGKKVYLKKLTELLGDVK